jgi:predicted phosphoribosyltransferase
MEFALNVDGLKRFQDAREAGRALASGLDATGLKEESGIVVVAIARGGVPVAAEVARHLGATLDTLFIRRLLVPQGMESQVCAVNVCGTLVLDEGLPPRPSVPESPLDYFIADALGGLERSVRACRGARPVLDLARRTVLLVDNGIRTGLTMRTAIRALRTLGPERIVAAVPVAAPESRSFVEPLADELVCLAWPHPFGHVGVWYRDFARLDDEQIRELLEQHPQSF